MSFKSMETFDQALKEFRTVKWLTMTVAAILGALGGMIAGAALGMVVGGVPGAIAGVHIPPQIEH